MMKITSNIIHLVFAIAFFAVVIYLANIGAANPEAIYINDFNREWTQDDADYETYWRNLAKVTNTAVTAEDVASLVPNHTNICVELTVDEVFLRWEYIDERGMTLYQHYTVKGTDRTGAPWGVEIYRWHIAQPYPVSAFPEGSKIAVYGTYLGENHRTWGDADRGSFVEDIDDTMPWMETSVHGHVEVLEFNG